MKNRYNYIILALGLFIFSYSVLSYDLDSFLNLFCEIHEEEIVKCEIKCFQLLHVEVKNTLGYCMMSLRNRRAPYKSIDGKFRQFCICDNQIRLELHQCEMAEFAKLKVNYNISQNFFAMAECIYAEMLVIKRLAENKQNKKVKPTPKKKSG